MAKCKLTQDTATALTVIEQRLKREIKEVQQSKEYKIKFLLILSIGTISELRSTRLKGCNVIPEVLLKRSGGCQR